MSDDQKGAPAADTPSAPPSTFHLALDANNVVVGKVHSNCDQEGMVDVDEATFGQAVLGHCTYVAGALQPYAPPAAPPPPRRATLAALFDPLSPAQRASITPDHLMRLQADAATAPDGTVYVGSSKVACAAGDLGMAPGDWFKLAGV